MKCKVVDVMFHGKSTSAEIPGTAFKANQEDGSETYIHTLNIVYVSCFCMMAY
jgi:hypothetical protein